MRIWRELLSHYLFQPRKYTDQLCPVGCIGGVLAIWVNPQLLVGVGHDKSCACPSANTLRPISSISLLNAPGLLKLCRSF